MPDPVKEEPRVLPIKEWVKIEKDMAQHNREMQKILTRFLTRAYGGLLIATVAIILCQGFHLWGFNLDPAFLNWLGAATVGEVSGLLALVYGTFFRKRDR